MFLLGHGTGNEDAEMADILMQQSDDDLAARLALPRRPVDVGPPVDRTATRGGARALRREGKLGQLAVGCDADLLLLDLDTVAFTPLNDLKRQLVHCEDGASVRMTIVAGRVVYEQGCITTVDEAGSRLAPILAARLTART